MRYFISLSFPEAFLPFSVIKVPLTTFVVFLRSSFEGILTGFVTAAGQAITATPITAATDHNRRIATQTVKQTSTLTHWLKMTVRAGYVADKVPDF